ncbi:5-oxoprolinase subunit PxpB [Rhodobacterales bacterium HKCCE2091]|nr:5-oxoprolinase subunit PxpB [Rhodobacterales bacterium HKCCE2091]
MSDAAPRILPCGDSALSVDFGNVISVEVNARVHALDAALRARAVPGVTETVPTYRALLVVFDPLTVEVAALEAEIARLMSLPVASAADVVRRWRVPVVFGQAHGADLADCAEGAGIAPERFVERFCAASYRVMMIGFMPGFSYLAGLPDALARPRRAVPRAQVPAGSVSIGGAQAAIGSVACPSGWHLVGRTPALPFRPGRDPVFLFEAGDEIRFEPVHPREWDRLAARAAEGDPVIAADAGR